MSARSCGRTHRERWKAANGGDVRSGSVRVVLDQIGDGDVVGSGSATWAVNHRNPSRVCITMGCVHGGEKSACARGMRVLRQLEDVGYDICVLYIDTDKLRKREESLSVLTYVPRVGKEFMPVGEETLVDV